MSRIDDIIEGKIRHEVIFGGKGVVKRERDAVAHLVGADDRAKKAADVAIGMLTRLFDPTSPYATSPELEHVPVIFAHSDWTSDDGNQLMTFTRIAKTIAAGHGKPDGLIMPYEKRVLPVITSPQGGRMIVGQLVHIEQPITWQIPGTEERLEYLEQQRQKVKTENELLDMPLLPEFFTHMAVLAHADRGGLNNDLFDMALANQADRQAELRTKTYIPIADK